MKMDEWARNNGDGSEFLVLGAFALKVYPTGKNKWGASVNGIALSGSQLWNEKWAAKAKAVEYVRNLCLKTLEDLKVLS